MQVKNGSTTALSFGLFSSSIYITPIVTDAFNFGQWDLASRSTHTNEISMWDSVSVFPNQMV